MVGSISSEGSFTDYPSCESTAQTGACCVSFQPGSNQSCFVTENTGSPSDTSYRCAPTLPVIRPDSVLVKRCADSTVCGYHQQCAKLQDSQELVRLALWIPSSVTGQSQLEDQTDEHLDVVVWSGPRDEILDSGIYQHYHQIVLALTWFV